MFDFSFPYSSIRVPIFARNVVATSQPLAAQVGLAVLQKGGNAVDAAVATAIALTVVEPTSNGIGGDAFAIVWDGKQLHGLNASGRSPRKLTRERFKGLDTMPLHGWNAVTVPGAVSAWVELVERFGKLPFDSLVEPAIRYARDGFQVSPYTAAGWAKAAQRLNSFEEFSHHFLPNGRAPRVGETFRSEDQARTLMSIAESKGASFYRGALADRIVADARKHEFPLDEEDLATHASEWVGTIHQAYRDTELHEIPPNGQGLAALIMLGILKHHPVADYPVDGVASLHVQIEAMKLALADAYRYVADPAAMDISPSSLLDHAYLAERASLIDMERAQTPTFGTPARSGTVYLTTADAEGMMVSFIQSNYHGFGSGIVIPGTGISMQNRGSGFTLEEGHPNEVGGSKRPFNTIIPAFVTQKGRPLMSLGVMGGAMQAQGHAQMMVRLCDYQQNPQAASDAPRWRILEGRRVALESAFDPDTIEALRKRGHDVIVEDDPFMGLFFGGAQLIAVYEDGYCAATDYRRDGLAVGY